MKLFIFALLVGVGALASTIPTKTFYGQTGKVADKIFLERQKDLLRLLMQVHQPNTFQDQVQIAKTFDIESNLNLFTNTVAIKEFIRLYRVGLLPRKEIFSVLNEVQRRQVVALFHVMYYARSWDVFYKVCCWARDYVNEGMFVYALHVAVLHRPDCRGIILPAPYEIYPYYYVNSDVIKKAQEYKMQNYALFKPDVLRRLYQGSTLTTGKYNTIKDQLPYWKKTGENWEDTQHFMPGHQDLLKNEYYNRLGVKDESLEKEYVGEKLNRMYQDKYLTKPYETIAHTDRLAKGVIGETVGDYKVVVIPYNYTGWYLNVERDQKLTYFTEDIGLNSYYFYFHTDYPFWMGGQEYGLNKDRRGELYYYFHQQLLARYYLERLSNGLGKIDLVDITKPVKTSYVCSLTYENGLPFPIRPKYTELIYDDYTKLTAEKLKILEKRILDAIDSGFVITEDGQKVNLYTENGINVLGNLIHGNKDSINRRFYSYIAVYAKILLGYGGKPLTWQRLRPSALELYSTAMRDPIFYSIYKKIVYYFLYYKKNLPSYTYNDLVLPGVKIESIVVDKLITYFDYYDIELNNALYSDFTQEVDIPKVIVKARQMRLNHKPFVTRINVVCDKTTKVVVRLFLGPKYNEKGQIININDNRVNFVEIDKWVWELKQGKNVIERNSREARHTVRDRTSYYNLYRKVMLALQGTEEFILDNTEAHCGFPNRLLLPKGKKGGMQYQLFVMITPYQGVTDQIIDEKQIYSCGISTGERFIDNLPLGYPLDRKIDLTQFFVPNMYFKDVTIYHKRVEDVVDLAVVNTPKKGIDITF